MNKLEIKNLHVEARKPSGQWWQIIHDVSVTVNQGEVVALIGESGAGKSTIGLASMAYARPGCRIKSGEILLNGKDLTKVSPEELRQVRGQQISYVAQSAAMSFNPSMTLSQQVGEALMVHGQPRMRDDQDWVVELFKMLDLPKADILGQRYPHQVSGGQLQRVMTSMAISCLPQFIVFDEPTTALDVTTQIEVLKAIKEVIKKQGTGAIYVTHDLSVVAQMADRIVVLRYGKVVEENTTHEIIRNPRHPYTRELMAAVRLIPEQDKITLHQIEKTENPLLSVDTINASYVQPGRFSRVRKRDYILHDVTFDVNAGEVVALVGESGSGKSTIARSICGLLPPISGEAKCKGVALPGHYQDRSLRQLQRFQFVVQNPDTSLNPEQTVGETIGRPLELFFDLTSDQKKERITELLDMVELPPDYAHRFPYELSGGEKQRISLARALAAEPELLLCDEVLSALDTVVAASVLELMKRLRKKLSMAYLFISHDLATVAEIADRVVVLYAGRVCENGPVDKVFAPPYHPYTALLLSSVPQMKVGWLEEALAKRGGVIGQSSAPTLEKGACSFSNRCPLYEKDICKRTVHEPIRVSKGHYIYCQQGLKTLDQDHAL